MSFKKHTRGTCFIIISLSKSEQGMCYWKGECKAPGRRRKWRSQEECARMWCHSYRLRKFLAIRMDRFYGMPSNTPRSRDKENPSILFFLNRGHHCKFLPISSQKISWVMLISLACHRNTYFVTGTRF